MIIMEIYAMNASTVWRCPDCKGSNSSSSVKINLYSYEVNICGCLRWLMFFLLLLLFIFRWRTKESVGILKGMHCSKCMLCIHIPHMYAHNCTLWCCDWNKCCCCYLGGKANMKARVLISWPRKMCGDRFSFEICMKMKAFYRNFDRKLTNGFCSHGQMSGKGMRRRLIQSVWY